jgi:hypothetical protein
LPTAAGAYAAEGSSRARSTQPTWDNRPTARPSARLPIHSSSDFQPETVRTAGLCRAGGPLYRGQHLPPSPGQGPHLTQTLVRSIHPDRKTVRSNREIFSSQFHDRYDFPLITPFWAAFRFWGFADLYPVFPMIRKDVKAQQSMRDQNRCGSDRLLE